MRLLLHACCGPCSLEPVRMLQEEDAQFSILYSNSNIHPNKEYRQRLDALREHVTQPGGIELIEDAYDSAEWEREVGVFGTDRERRCRACYRLRFEKLAAIAREQGFDAIGSTLTISPYQYTAAILEELERAAQGQGLESAGTDYSSCYAQATRRSRELGMYRQNYCGCRFSIAEAEAERRERAEQRARQKQLRQLALMQAASEGVVNQQSLL
ncbi:MAG: epoxyqueuosine reductase QueH [Coriobacteriales bacterium]